MLRSMILTCMVCFAAIHAVKAEDIRSSGASGQPPSDRSPAHPGYVGKTVEVVPLTTLQSIERAERVLYVRSNGSEVKRGIGGNIFTYTTFEVLQVIKGSTGAEIITLRLLGGRIGDEVVDGPLDLDFKRGDRFVLFLGKNNSEGYPTLIPQAVFEVKTLGRVEVVDPTPNGLQFYHASDGRAYSASPALARLDDFIFSLERAR